MPQEPNWSELRHADGPADDLPDLLAELDPNPQAEIWGTLFSLLLDQGDTFPASPYALEPLLNAAEGYDPSGRIMPLALASGIVNSPQFPSAGFEAAIEGLRRIALETAEAANITRADRVYVMQAVLACSGNEPWSQAIEGIADEQVNAVCPQCREHLLIGIVDAGCHVAPWSDESRRNSVAPDQPHKLPPPGDWLHATALRAQDAGLAHIIADLFGQAKCPTCFKVVELPAAIEKYERGGE